MKNENEKVSETEEGKVSSSPGEEKIVEKKMEYRRPLIAEIAERNGFNFGRLFLGIIILLIGLFYLGQNAGLIPKEFGINIFLLWPVFIIYLGLAVMGGRNWLLTLLGVIGTLVILSIVAMILFMGNFGYSTAEVRTMPVKIVRDASATSGIVNIENGAGTIVIRGGSLEFIEGELKANFLDLKQNSSLSNNVQTVDLEATGVNNGRWNWGMGMMRYVNDLNLKLNSGMPLKIYLKSGASTIDIDSSDIMLDSAEIDAGASTINLRLGDKVNDSSVKINAGASTLRIHIPQSVGVKLMLDGGLSSTRFDKFVKIDDKNYESENYSSSDKKINITMDVGVSNVEIDRY